MGSLCGIDEAGRGPIAGDLVVAGVILTAEVEGLNDSKKLSEKRREELYEKIVKNAYYHIVKFSSKEIDTMGISEAIKKALLEIITTLQADSYLFDGNSTFGVDKKILQTQVKADADVLEVSAASILAKVTHDRGMIKAAKKYPQYGFEAHKGYGTKRHIEAIKKYGYCEYHRRSYRVKALEGIEL